MTDAEKRVLLNAIYALEVFYFENVALNTSLERWSQPNWETERDQISNDPNFLPDLREVFVRFRDEIEQTLPSDSVLQQLEWILPMKNKPT